MILWTVNENSRRDKEQELMYTMNRVEYNLTETINNCIGFTNNFYIDRALDEFLNRNYSSNLSYYDEYIRLSRENRFSYNYNNGILNQVLIYADNETILSGGRFAKLSLIKETDWYKEYKDSGLDVFIYPYFEWQKRYAAGSGTPKTISIIRKLDYFRDIGVEKCLKIDIDYGIMLRDVQNEKVDAEIYVRNQDYILFSNLSNESSMRDFTPASAVDESKVTMSKTFKAANQQWEILILSEDAPFWSVIVENKGLLWLVVMNVFIPTLLIYFVGKSISKRLSLVANYMDKVKKEQFEEINIKEGEDEIGKLIQSYNLMVRKIKNLIEVVFKGKAEKQALELSKKQAELKAIQSQVNPHFMFNTLETIRMRSLLKGENETADIIGELAILFRKSMSWGTDYITIAEEMTFIAKYINIQKYRFGDKIKFYHYVMEGCEQFMVPKLAIGTFVENACIHGIETTVNDGVISLTITKNKEYLFIEVSDNGRGIEKEKLDKLVWMLEHADSKMLNESKSTGILNAFLRLKMYCDGNIEFDIDSKLEKGTDITIQIPLPYVDPKQMQNKITQEVFPDD
jgi:two-component system sensor histidine kinase YesM